MNIQDNTSKALTSTNLQSSLPPLVKGHTIYKIIVPQKVEEKIRYLCRKFPNLEWSGILFTTHEGNFEDGSLIITCQDIYPMDLGTSTYTDFKMDETVAGYIAENIDLFGCDMSLIHSHNQMSCWFSGTDLSTLQSEGNDQNCFVSLIVNNAGKYCAAITRKVKEKKIVITKDFSSTYEFFGDGEKAANMLAEPNEEKVTNKTYIEYFDLEVQVEQVSNHLAYLDARFDEIEAKKKKDRVIQLNDNVPLIPKSKFQYNPGNDFDKDYSFGDWQKAKREQEIEEPTLFSKEEMAEMTDISKWEPNQTAIHDVVCKMVACSLIIDTAKFDLKQWITRHMERKYNEIFDSAEAPQFKEWKEFIVEFMIAQYNEPNIPDEVYDDYDSYQSKIASAMYNELYQYPANEYIKAYQEVLTRYMYE